MLRQKRLPREKPAISGVRPLTASIVRQTAFLAPMIRLFSITLFLPPWMMDAHLRRAG